MERSIVSKVLSVAGIRSCGSEGLANNESQRIDHITGSSVLAFATIGTTGFALYVINQSNYFLAGGDDTILTVTMNPANDRVILTNAKASPVRVSWIQLRSI